MKDFRELDDTELKEVTGASCANGRHISESELTTGSVSQPNPWQTWMQTYFGIATR